MKRALVATSSLDSDIPGDLLGLLKKAGFSTTVLCNARQRKLLGAAVNQWIDAGDALHLTHQKLAEEYENNPDFYAQVFITNDGLLYDVAHAPYPDSLKTKISPIGNPHFSVLMGSKLAAAKICEQLEIPHVPFRICRNVAQVQLAAAEIGYPVVVKFDQCAGGIGVFKCINESDLDDAFSSAQDRKLNISGDIIVEKYITGEELSPLPYFDKGRLLAYIVGRVLGRFGDYGVSYKQEFYFDPEFAPLFEKIGMALNYTGFINFGFMREQGTGKLWLFEMDLRPSIWVAYAQFAGIDFSDVLKNHANGKCFTWKDYAEKIKTKKISLFHRAADHFLLQSGGVGFLKFLFKNSFFLPFLPYHDPKLLFIRIKRIYNHWFSLLCDRTIAYLQRYEQNLQKSQKKNYILQTIVLKLCNAIQCFADYHRKKNP